MCNKHKTARLIRNKNICNRKLYIFSTQKDRFYCQFKTRTNTKLHVSETMKFRKNQRSVQSWVMPIMRSVFEYLKWTFYTNQWTTANKTFSSMPINRFLMSGHIICIRCIWIQWKITRLTWWFINIPYLVHTFSM